MSKNFSAFRVRKPQIKEKTAMRITINMNIILFTPNTFKSVFRELAKQGDRDVAI